MYRNTWFCYVIECLLEIRKLWNYLRIIVASWQLALSWYHFTHTVMAEIIVFYSLESSTIISSYLVVPVTMAQTSAPSCIFHCREKWLKSLSTTSRCVQKNITRTWNKRPYIWIRLPVDCLLMCFFRLTSTEIPKLRITGPFVRGIHWSPVLATGGFPWQRTSNAESVSISWRHHDKLLQWTLFYSCLQEMFGPEVQPEEGRDMSASVIDLSGDGLDGHNSLEDNDLNPVGVMWSVRILD